MGLQTGDARKDPRHDAVRPKRSWSPRGADLVISDEPVRRLGQCARRSGRVRLVFGVGQFGHV